MPPCAQTECERFHRHYGKQIDFVTASAIFIAAASPGKNRHQPQLS